MTENILSGYLTFSESWNKQARGQSFGLMSLHAWWRALLLILLGVFLRSTGSGQTNWTFEDTLSQIGMGYGLLFLLGFRPVRCQWIALGVILIGYFTAFALYPLPAADFDYAKVGVSTAWIKENELTGFAAHWMKNSNFAWAFDTWWMNLFPRKAPFTANGGGYSTLSFIPTLGTMILGLLAGEVLRSGRSGPEKLRWFLIAGITGIAGGWLLGALGVCPVVKRIWTPSWVLVSGGWCFLALAAFYAIIDVRGWRAWAFPLVVIGMNSIAAYLMEWLFPAFIRDALRRHLGPGVLEMFGPAYAPFVLGVGVVGVMWLLLYAMYRRKIFLRI